MTKEPKEKPTAIVPPIGESAIVPLVSLSPMGKLENVVLPFDDLNLPAKTHPVLNVLRLHNYSYREDSRRVHSLLPAQALRRVRTGLLLQYDPSLRPVVTTPMGILAVNCETVSIQCDSITSELFVWMKSYRSDAHYLAHGDLIAYLYFDPIHYFELESFHATSKS